MQLMPDSISVMHLVDSERPDRHVLEPERVCEALGSLPGRAVLDDWTQRFGLLSDPTRLTLLLSMAAAGPISVTDLAAAADVSEATVSQALRLLRATGTVTATRDGRVIRYQLADTQIEELLRPINAGRGHHRHKRHTTA